MLIGRDSGSVLDALLVQNMIDTYIKTSVPINAPKQGGVGKQMQESEEEDKGVEEEAASMMVTREMEKRKQQT